MSIKWNSDEVMKFLQQYYNHPCLWDVNHPHYKRRDKRDEALREMMNVFGITSMALLKLKIHSIRNTYINELGKVSNGAKNSNNEVYVPKLAWFSFADSFLRRVIQKRKVVPIQENVRVKAEPIEIQDEAEQSSEDDSWNCQTVSSEHVQQINRYDNDSSRENASFRYETTEVPQEKGRSHPEYLLPHGNIVEPMEQITSMSSLRDKPIKSNFRKEMVVPSSGIVTETKETAQDSHSQDDELDFFGKSIVSQMRKLPEEYVVSLMADIQNIITEKRLQFLAASKQF